MKNLVLILYLVCSTIVLYSQNLIINPSFEDIDSCYGGASPIGFDVFEWTGCKGWSCPIASSSDLWCENGVFSSANPPDIAGFGYQEPRTGENMAGILENDGVVISYREFVQNELIQPLDGNLFYRLSFYHSPLKVDCSINELGVLALTNKMNNTGDLDLSHLTPNGVSDVNQFTGDTSVWNYCEIIFKANGGEKFIVIGNFQDSTNATYAEPCDTSFWNGLSYAGNYFFLDDFTLEKIPSEYSIPNVFTPNNDGINDFFELNIVNIPDWELVILNRWGNTVNILNSSNDKWDGNSFSDGVYFYKFSSENLEINDHGFFQLIR